MRTVTFLSAVFLSSLAFSQSTIMVGSTPVEVDTVYTGLDVPWEIIYGPDDHIWTTERYGIVSRIDPVNNTKTVILDLTGSVYANSESGLLGMVLHPDFATTPEVFLAYTYQSSGNIRERIVKYTYDGTNLINPQTLLEDIAGNTTHIGARFLFLTDGTLLVSTGDAQNSSLPQDLNSTSGKVLRMNTDGSIPANNPMGASSYVYSFGHRNVQGMFQKVDGTIYISEHGASSDDEFQILQPGRNYGWPNVEGFCDAGTTEETFCLNNNVAEPITIWTPTIAPSDLVYYQNPLFPEFDGKILMTVLKDKKLIAFEMGGTMGEVLLDETHYLTNMFGRLRDICVGPDQTIYLATNGSSWSNIDPGTHSIVSLKVAGNVGIQDAEKIKIGLVPNPANDQLQVEVSDQRATNAQLVVVDMNGKVLLQDQLTGGKTAIDLSTVEQGIYLVTLELTDGTRAVKRFVRM